MRQKVNLLEVFPIGCGFVGFTFIFLNWMNFKLHLHIYTDNRPVLEKILFYREIRFTFWVQKRKY